MTVEAAVKLAMLFIAAVFAIFLGMGMVPAKADSNNACVTNPKYVNSIDVLQAARVDAENRKLDYQDVNPTQQQGRDLMSLFAEMYERGEGRILPEDWNIVHGVRVGRTYHAFLFRYVGGVYAACLRMQVEPYVLGGV